MKSFVTQYLYNWAVLLSQALSVLLGGHPDESISQRTGRAYLSNPKGWFRVQRFAIDMLLKALTGEADHCLNSLKGEANAKELWSWGKKDKNI